MLEEQCSIALFWRPPLVSSLCSCAILKVALHLPGKWCHLSLEVPLVLRVRDLGNGAYIHSKFSDVITLSGTYQPAHRLQYLLQLKLQAILA